ncbi:MAG TPA: crosslink repair DNA glycosylase YcaQ family protein [Gaiellaceae bacterium]|nr:crosslink repair DNA glycosylase YcaQ family protein [Gaiellaceae bacterium]
MRTRLVDTEQARRIAGRAQLRAGSATGVLETVRRLGFLQLDPIATVARPQHLVLWSRLGPYDRAELDRLLWVERALIEWDAFVWPVETLPLLQALMRRHRRASTTVRDRRIRDFLRRNARFRRYVLAELEARGPLLARELEDISPHDGSRHEWYGRRVPMLLELLLLRGELAIVGRRNGQRLWDLAERWYPETETVPLRVAERRLAEQRFRALGVRLERGAWHAHPEAADGPVPDRATLLSPFDRLVHDRARAEALFGFRYRLEMYVPEAKREYGYYVLPLLVGDRLVGRAEPRFDRETKTLRLLGAWGDTSRLDEALGELATFLGAARIES